MDSSSEKPLKPPSDLIRLGEGGTLVEDADEETFDLYSNLANTGSEESNNARKGGLGFLDSHKDTLEIDFELQPPSVPLDSALSPKLRHSKIKSHKAKKSELQSKNISVSIHQDIGALRNRKGDTGSVVWRASLFLAEFLLQQFYFPLPTFTPLINPTLAKTSSVLELGAGTGLSSVLLHEIFGSWTATDQYDNLKLISRNLKENKLEDVVGIKEVDWFQSLEKASQSSHRQEGGEYDLVLAIDCIYNEALIKPLVATFDRYTMRRKTLVWVVIELRSSDVVTAFLEEWLSHDGWTIYRLGEEAMGPKMARGFVGWIGWRE
ncbi:hypothetical protein FFLO_00141 [Filobasidium floriforme]|uniref:Uncharacterized protein n=1 Tax=Filobasidium floriforme TaxID=5210 RepID=A0A8K0JT71_9TREE|nr:hypothetical protein FFLO_00141 [Filobasidium floriforme]